MARLNDIGDVEVQHSLKFPYGTFFAVVVTLAAFVLSGAVIQKSDSFLEKDLSATGEWIYLDPAIYNVVVFTPVGSSFDGATATVETIVQGDPDKQTKIKDVGVPTLVDITAETEWTKVSIGAGYYRLRIDNPGAETFVSWHGRKASR